MKTIKHTGVVTFVILIMAIVMAWGCTHNKSGTEQGLPDLESDPVFEMEPDPDPEQQPGPDQSDPEPEPKTKPPAKPGQRSKFLPPSRKYLSRRGKSVWEYRCPDSMHGYQNELGVLLILTEEPAWMPIRARIFRKV